MKVLLIQPSEFADDTITPEYKKRGRLKVLAKSVIMRPACLPPMGLLYVANSIKRANHEVAIIDAVTLQLTNREIVQEIVHWTPDLVGISLYSWRLREAHSLTASIKKALRIPIVLGGPHPTALPDETLAEFKDADFLLTGWADFSIINFLDMLEGRTGQTTVPGLCYRANNTITKNSPSTLPSNLDEIPFPDRSVIDYMYDNDLYYNITTPNRKIDIIMTSRNCPFTCRFCQNLTGHKYLPHSPEHVIEEIDYLVSRGVSSIEIMDDTFTVNRKRVEKIFDLIESRHHGLDFRIRSRVNLIDKQLLHRFKRIGGRAVSYGLESGSDAVLGLMHKQTTVADNAAACLATKEAGLICHSTWLFGWPGESLEDIDCTFEFIKQYLPTTFNIGVLIPLPGTPIYDEARENGTLDKDWSVTNTSLPYVKTALWPNRADLVRLLDRKMFYLQINPRYLWQTMLLIVRFRNTRLFSYGANVVFRKVCRAAFYSAVFLWRQPQQTFGRLSHVIERAIKKPRIRGHKS
ncbi:MAG: radical SAM protein [Planctomycetota bacterium]|nr:radical SAM protein [Planctomycetota bacterium]